MIEDKDLALELSSLIDYKLLVKKVITLNRVLLSIRQCHLHVWNLSSVVTAFVLGQALDVVTDNVLSVDLSQLKTCFVKIVACESNTRVAGIHSDPFEVVSEKLLVAKVSIG